MAGDRPVAKIRLEVLARPPCRSLLTLGVLFLQIEILAARTKHLVNIFLARPRLKSMPRLAAEGARLPRFLPKPLHTSCSKEGVLASSCDLGIETSHSKSY
eukprot:13658242-Heterocapsa_arctica.AAC.1